MNDATRNNGMVGLLIVAVFAMIPLYVIPSGGLHIVDIPIACLSLLVLLSARFSEVDMSLDWLAPFVPFLAWVLIVGSYYAVTSSDYKPYMLGAAQSVYNLYLLLLFTIIFGRILSQHNRFSYLYVGLLAACSSPWLLNTHSALPRNGLSFNNPNQLAYHAILILLVMIFITNEIITEQRKLKPRYMIAYGIVFLCCNVFIYISESRAGILASGILDIYILIKMVKIRKLSISITTLLIRGGVMAIFMCAIYFAINNPQHLQNDLLSRIDKKQLIDIDDMYHRTLQNLTFDSDSSLILGNGGIWKQEPTTKVSRVFKKEVHNSILGVLNDYGIVGCLLFVAGSLIFVYRLYVPNKWILMVSLVIYNMSHYGLRFRLLWIALALLAAVSVSRRRRMPAFSHDPVLQPMALAQEMR
jgi:hypothetical protein